MAKFVKNKKMDAPILLKVPLLIIGTLGPHIGVTPPNRPASKEEKNGFGKGSQEVMSSSLVAYWSPYFFKVCFSIVYPIRKRLI